MLEDGGLGQILDHAIPTVAPSCVGGGTNLGQFPLMRPPAALLAHWAELGAIAEPGVLERALEGVAGLLGEQRLAAAATDRPPSAFATALGEQAAAPVQQGWPSPENMLVNRPALTTLLDDVPADRLALLSECAAQRIVLDGGRAVAVDARLAGRRALRITAETIVVAAGAPHSCGCSAAAASSAATIPACRSCWVRGSWPSCRSPPSTPPHRCRAPGPRRTACSPSSNLRRRPLRCCWPRRPTSIWRSCCGSSGFRRCGRSSAPRRASAVSGVTAWGWIAAPPRRTSPGCGAAPMTAFRAYASAAEAAALKDLPAAQLQLSLAYALSGAAMSKDPARGVVDSRFRVHGHENVFVCDASVFPTSVPVEPQLTVIALAFAAAGEILDD